MSLRNNFILSGVLLAVLAAFIWSGNFIVARGIKDEIPPVSLAFYRWACATIILLPITIKNFLAQWPVIKKHLSYFTWTALAGVTIFNTLVYVGGHYTSAINLALIGTVSSPVFSVILARIFLNEKIGWQKITGMAICVAGIFILLVKGNFHQVALLNFSTGDIWILLAAISFAVYNILARKKPADVSPGAFLFTIFALGTLLLIPFFIWERTTAPGIRWNLSNSLIILYLGLGASVICFLIWNKSISILGAGRTALFGNLIPLFSIFEALLILKESFHPYHLVSSILILAGLMLANFVLFKSFLKK